MTTNNATVESLTPTRASFWRRQFSRAGTEQQATFDIAFGLLIPVLCFYLDPVVFKGDFLRGPIVQSYQLFAYGVAALEVTLFTIYMLCGARLGAWSPLIGGALISGSVFSAVTGVMILPYSLVGLMVVIGALGFIPFITAFVYLRAGWRALTHEAAPIGSLINCLVIGAVLSLGVPALASIYVSRSATNSIEVILHGNPQQAELALAHLRRLPMIPQHNLEPLMQGYLQEKDPERKQLLKNCYQLIAGEDIDHRIAIIND
jgi:hypothetical protein